MKAKHIFCALLLCITTAVAAQPAIDENESAIIYYMPFTWVDIDIQYQQITTEAGPFVQYAERYLGTKDIITENAITYVLTDVDIRTHTTADTQRAYKVPLTGKGVKAPLITLNKQGILQAINLQEQMPDASEKKVAPAQRTPNAAPRTCMPLLEEQMMANSIAKMAEGAARQIYRIRETRLNILAGDVEHTPADGEAMKLVLQELDAQEQALTALFVGTKTIKTLHKTYLLNPEKLTNSTLFRFSQFAGPVAADDLSGEPYQIDVQKSVQHYTATEEQVPSKYPTYIFYNLPGSTTIQLLHNEDILIEKTIPVAQFGISIPLNQQSGLKDSQIIFDTQTGSILSITK